jgi:hypothetical protein
MGHLLKLKFAHSPLKECILSSFIFFTLTTVQVPTVNLVETKQIKVSANGFSKKILDFRNHFMNNSITKNTLFKMYPKICFMIRPKMYFSSRRLLVPSGNFKF